MSGGRAVRSLVAGIPIGHDPQSGVSIPEEMPYGSSRLMVVSTMYVGSRMWGVFEDALCRIANQKRG